MMLFNILLHRAYQNRQQLSLPVSSQTAFLISLEPSIRIYPIMNTSQLTQRFLLDLYLAKPTTVSHPLLQILAFENSQHNPKEINIRLSDGSTFFDATLLGPYEISNDKIVVSAFTPYHGAALSFKKYDIIKVLDFFSKIDETKICRLKMVIRKIGQGKPYQGKINRPEELAFYVQINGLIKDAPQHFSSEPTVERPRFERQEWILTQKNPAVGQAEIKICDEDELATDPKKNDKKISVISKELQILGITKDRNPDEPLTCRDIFNGFEGFFIGRLLRMKPTVKESKGLVTQMLALGFLDSSGDMMRLNLLGKLAVKEEKELKIGKCYYIKGLELVQTKGTPYIKLREKDYRLHLLNQQQITSKFQEEYYHWEHEYDYIENEMVDIVGVVEDIEEKTNYGVKEIGDQKEIKEVIRVVIRNKFKTVKINFWSDQLKNLSKLNLKKGEAVIIEDVRKKKLVFLDFSVQSTVIRLQPQCQLYHKLAHLLPENHDYGQPINIASIYQIQQLDKYNTKVHTINAHLLRLQEQKIVFKMCDLCKKKININSTKCFDCKGNVMSFKYNTNIEFGDYSGSIWVSVYDSIAEKLFGISALKFKEIKENSSEYQEFEYGIFYQPYQIGIEIKSERFILRTVEVLRDEDMGQWCRQSVKNIGKLCDKGQG